MIGEEMKALRKSMAYTQEGLANALGVSRKTINEMENGATIDKRTELALIAESKRVRVIEHVYWVDPTILGTYAVAERLNREIEKPGVMFYSLGQSRLFGEFRRRDHAYRWMAALRQSDNARETRKLSRKRLAEMAN